MASREESESIWGSRKQHLTVLLCYTVGVSTFLVLPHTAAISGSTGYILGYIICNIVLGIPLLYLEFVVSQFTSRDSIDVWKARSCLSHVGYLVFSWQICVCIVNHVLSSFKVHYFLISFEDPIPYYICGEWAEKNCNILRYNHTVNEDCIKLMEPLEYCENLHETFPEYQYWRKNILGLRVYEHFHVAWRVTLASGLICIFMYLCCFKRKASVRWFVNFLFIYPMLGYLLFMIGSMLQKGIVMKYQEAIDVNFDMFLKKIYATSIIHNTIHNLGIGTGIPFSLASHSAFRSPCSANTVIIVVISAMFATIAVFTGAMMFCPYAYVYGTSPRMMISAPMTMIFEKTPRLLYEYSYKSFWLILVFSCSSVLGIGTNVIVFFVILDVIAIRCRKVSQYPGMTCFIGILLLFLISMPLLGKLGMELLLGFKRFVNLLGLFITMLESLVFVLWYGIDKFAEDVHFMNGIQSGNLMKGTWIISSVILGYVFVSELYFYKINSKNTIGDLIGFYGLVAFLAILILLALIKILIAACKKNVMSVLELDPTWGPKNEVLHRSRAMFTGQAMTKEYMYRQYHLQAGIQQRQKMSNSRKHSEL